MSYGRLPYSWIGSCRYRISFKKDNLDLESINLMIKLADLNGLPFRKLTKTLWIERRRLGALGAYTTSSLSVTHFLIISGGLSKNPRNTTTIACTTLEVRRTSSEEEERMGIFQPFRAIGYITSSVPFSVQRLGTETFVTVSVGKSWQIYNESMQVRKGLFGVLCAFRCVLPLLLGWPGFGGVWMPGAARGREGNPVTTGIRGWSADQAMKMSGDMTT
ncbi:hypothetical protein LguiB_016845 [Lonicera macranthoides]